MGQYNCGGYANAEADKMVMEANTETDPAKRAAILQKVEAMLIDDAAYVPLHWEDPGLWQEEERRHQAGSQRDELPLPG